MRLVEVHAVHCQPRVRPAPPSPQRITAARGRGAAFSGVAYSGGVMRCAAVYLEDGGRRVEGDFNGVVDLTSLRVGRSCVLLLGHDWKQVLGLVRAFRKTAAGLRITGAFDSAPPAAALAPLGFGLSLGVVGGEVLSLPEGKSLVLNGRRVRGPCSLCLRGILQEISITPLGNQADKGAVGRLAVAPPPVVQGRAPGRPAGSARGAMDLRAVYARRAAAVARAREAGDYERARELDRPLICT